MTQEDRPSNSAVDLSAPAFDPPDDWRPFRPGWLLEDAGTFVSGDPGSRILRVRYFEKEGHRGIFGLAWFGPGAEGPPEHAHGGTTSAVLDEAMGTAAWKEDLRSVAGRLEVDFVRSIPLGEVLQLEAWIESVDGSKVHLCSTLQLRGETVARGRALFVRLDASRAAKFAARFSSRPGDKSQ